jgi:hypothetical protein
LVDATVLLVHVLLAKSAVCFLVIAPPHVVLAPMPGAPLHFLLVNFSLLWRDLLPILILLLFSFVSIVLPVLLFLIIASTLLLVSSFVVIFDSCSLLEVGDELEPTLESSKFSLHCHNLVFVW